MAVVAVQPAPESRVLAEGDVRTARQSLAWGPRGWLVAYLLGSALLVRDDAAGTVEVIEGSGVGSFALAACPAGAAIVYVRGGSVYARVRQGLGAWSGAVKLGAGVGPIPSVACWASSAGVLVEVAWHLSGGGIYACRYTGRGWEPAVRLDDGARPAQYPSVCVDGSGGACCAWEETSSTPGTGSTLRAADKPNGAQWSRAALSSPGDDPSVAWDGLGPIVGWQDAWRVFVGSVDGLGVEIVVQLDPPASTRRPTAKRPGAGALFAGMAADPERGWGACVYSYWTSTLSPEDYTTRTVRCAVETTAGWEARVITAATGYQGQPSIAYGGRRWGVAWTEHSAGEGNPGVAVRLVELV